MSKRRKLQPSSKVEPVPIEKVHIHEVPNLGVLLPDGHAEHDNTQICAKGQETGAGGYNKLIGDQEHIIADIKRSATSKTSLEAFVRAGPRQFCFFTPSETNIAIVTCGGLCPGLNAVIYGIVKSASELYGVRTVYGIRGGYHGFYSEDASPMILTTKNVAGIQHQGGTILGAARGGFDLPKIINFLKEKSVAQLYVIGGDGTHRGLIKIYEETIKQGLKVAVAGIPKTIDNDLGCIDHSFGFSTAVEEACKAVLSAKTEASCAPNGVGIVKLMGRSAGYISAHTTIATQVRAISAQARLQRLLPRVIQRRYQLSLDDIMRLIYPAIKLTARHSPRT
jgi:6-phosphofructokinase 1